MKRSVVFTLVLGMALGLLTGCEMMMTPEQKRQAHENATIKALVHMQAAIEVYNSLRSYADRLMDPRDLFEEMPEELVTGSNEVAFEFDGSGGWLYDQDSCKLSLNLNGKDHKGRLYTEWWKYWKES